MQNSNIEAVLFDYDGTIIDSFQNCFNAYEPICDYLIHPRFESLEEFREWYDPEWMHNLTRLTQKGHPLTPLEINHIQNIYKNTIKSGNAPLRPGMHSLIHWASKNFKLGIVSGSYKEDILPRLESHNLLSYFTVVIDHHDGYIKPHPKTMEMALNVLEITPDHACYIGDCGVDVAFARNANMRAVILCSKGWESMNGQQKALQKYNVQPDILVDSPHQIQQYLKQLSGKDR